MTDAIDLARVANGTTNATTCIIGRTSKITKIDTSTTTNYAAKLPLNPILYAPYEVMVDGGIAAVGVTAAGVALYPPVGGTINGMAANSPVYLPIGSTSTCVPYSALAWQVKVIAPDIPPVITLPDQKNVTPVVLIAAQTGNTFSVAAQTVGGASITLPAPSPGLKFRIIMGATAGQIVTIVAGAGTLNSSSTTGGNNALIVVIGGNTNVLLAGTCVAGDGCYFEAFGSNAWRAIPFCSVNTRITTS
jgi:hypothetical protein